MTHQPILDRRTALRVAVTGTVGAMFAAGTAACTQASNPPAPIRETNSQAPTPSVSGQSTTSPDINGGRVLLAYFSRAGENYYYGDRIDLEVGNTEVLAGMIRESIGCDVYRIEAADPYPDDYEETVARNSREQRENARPAIAGSLPDLSQYETVLLASGIWGNRAPLIMTTFAEALDFKGKTIHPITTYAMSGLGSTERDYTASCPGATIAEGLPVRGEEVRDAGAAVEAWLRRTRLLNN
jgi:flavodoxin